MDPEPDGDFSFKQIFNKICRGLGDAKEVSKKFSELKTDEERFRLTYDICRHFISDLNFKRVGKTSEKFECLIKVGDANFAKNDYWEAIKVYNECIAAAPSGSDHLALGFYKRSLALFKLSFLKEAGDDCQSALILTQTDTLIRNIETQKEILLKATQKPITYHIGNGDLQPLKNGKSDFFDSASKSVGLSYNDKQGRYLIAEDDIKTGDVLIVEKPYSSVLLPNHLYLHCTHCFKRSLNLKPCSNCSFAMFCSDDCQNESLKHYHNTECKILDILIGLKLSRMELLSLRILLIASHQGNDLIKLYKETKQLIDVKNNNGENNIYKSSDFLNIYNLVTNTEKRTVSDLFYRSAISTVLIYLLEKYTSFFKSVENEENKDLLKLFCGGLVLRLMQNLPCNAHEISEFCKDGFDEIGAGAYATLSLINHSCDPNVVRYSCGDVIVLRAIKPIGKGEQIFDNYGYHYATHTLTERQTSLNNQYYFHCECEACVGVWPTYEDLPSEDLKLKKPIDLDVYKKKTEKFEENLREIFNGNFNLSTIEENMKYLDFLHEFVVCPWQNYNKCQEAIKHCLSFSGNYFRFSKGVFC